MDCLRYDPPADVIKNRCILRNLGPIFFHLLSLSIVKKMRKREKVKDDQLPQIVKAQDPLDLHHPKHCFFLKHELID